MPSTITAKMIKRVFLFLTILPMALFGQDTRQVKDKTTDETFFVLKSNPTVKHGEYKKFTHRNSLLLKGFYKQGLRDSIWENYDANGRIALKYNYTSNKLVYYKPNETLDKTYKVLHHSDTTRLSSAPIFLGGDNYILSALVKNYRFPAEARETKTSGKVHISFIVDKNGKASNFLAKNPVGKGVDEEVIRIFKMLPDLWIPGIVNGQAVDTEVVYPIAVLLN